MPLRWVRQVPRQTNGSTCRHVWVESIAKACSNYRCPTGTSAIAPVVCHGPCSSPCRPALRPHCIRAVALAGSEVESTALAGLRHLPVCGASTFLLCAPCAAPPAFIVNALPPLALRRNDQGASGLSRAFVLRYRCALPARHRRGHGAVGARELRSAAVNSPDQ